MAALMHATRTVPILFVQVPDPVGSGFVASLARPGGNATGFAQFDFSLSGKWLEVLKEIAPRVTHVTVLRDLLILRVPDSSVLFRSPLRRSELRSAPSTYASRSRSRMALPHSQTRRMVG